jgi:hypothetical protein
MPSNPQLIGTGLWQWLKGTGMERFELSQAADEWILRGTILSLTDNGSAEARYEIVCSAAWLTKSADISIREKGEERKLHITAEQGVWHVNGELNPAVQGCVDIDLGWTPSTNTLPIRRLQLDIRESSGSITAAWVRFPELKLEPLTQEYLRLSSHHYRYSSRGGDFVAQLSVDDEGVVLNYEGFWQRIPESQSA